ncbi:hypothetical protein GCM10027446_28090 [Angustibacter peucedani]
MGVRIAGGLAVVYLSLAWLLAQRYLRRAGWRVWPVLVAVPALVFTLNETRWYRFEHGLADAVRPVLAGRDAGFGCERLLHDFWSSQGRAGHVWFDADGTPASEAFLSGQTCSDVKAYRRHPSSATLDEVVAVHTVTHEAAHLAGQRDEARAECTAVQADAGVLRRLGAAPDVAQAQARRYLEQVFPRLPSDYTSGDCREDGPLDTSPHDGVWP